uniref:Uncharacterized protein n=1 Tax=Tetranychus urticae TaxID=32264 RepID=T1JT58_TETUR
MVRAQRKAVGSKRVRVTPHKVMKKIQLTLKDFSQFVLVSFGRFLHMTSADLRGKGAYHKREPHPQYDRRRG